jgi:hypothetical protein
MADLVVTVPRDRWSAWVREGDAAGDPSTGKEWGWFCRVDSPVPPIVTGERLYVCSWGRLRGYAPVTRVLRRRDVWVICRRAGAVAVTIPERIHSFRGWRERWWDREVERAFPDWRIKGTPDANLTLPGFER